MAVLVEAISVITRRDAIDAKYPGGWAAFISAAPNATGSPRMTARITKREAISAINRASALTLNSTSTHFANVNTSKSVCWFDIPVEKFTSGKYGALDLLLVSEGGNMIYHLRVPASYVQGNLSKFHVRDDKESVSLDLSSLASNAFQDVRPGSKKMPFAQFLVKSLSLALNGRPANG